MTIPTNDGNDGGQPQDDSYWRPDADTAETPYESVPPTDPRSAAAAPDATGPTYEYAPPADPQSAPPAPATTGPSSARPVQRNAILAVIVALILVATGAFGYLLGRDNGSTAATATNTTPATSPFGTSGPFGSQGSSDSPGSSGSSNGSGSSGATGSPASTNAANVAAKVDPAMVNITATVGSGTAKGSGMVITSNGEVLTNNHVIDGATSISVQLASNGKTYSATLLGYDVTEDVALLKINNVSGLQTVQTSSNVTVNDAVVVIGNAYGHDGTPSAVDAVINATNQTITASDNFGQAAETLQGLIQLSGNVVSGDSGGAVANTDGKVVAMTTAASVNGFNPMGVNATTTAYAIPIEHALAIANQIESGNGSSTVHIGEHGVLGVGVSDTNGVGAGVVGVLSNSAAASAGLTAGDTIVSLDGQAIRSTNDLNTAMRSTHVGDKVDIGWTDSAGTTHAATVTLTNGAG